ncbi:dihydroorotate dehydrogenase electron transfer subunit [Salipiger abyssi]|uniref:dihydroorotate dehydrogenase electron transfer subunit n=1 Tax=Salipiger abyssi TaxID=1250539 RepID=UPI004058014C
MEQTDAPVVSNTHLTGEYWLLEVEAPSVAAALEPGQFVNIRIRDSLAPFLRRPFSVYRVNPEKTHLQVAYKILGNGTRLMKETLQPGALCDLIGPLGKGFELPEDAKTIALVGRGIGIAALPMLADLAAARGVTSHAFLSARSRDNLVGAEIFASHGGQVFTHADDTPDDVALVTDHLLQMAESTAFDAMYVCGSNRLIRQVDKLARAHGIPAQSAMEQHMACGFGDCHGCIIEVNLDRDGESRGYREVCHHGPVFNTWEVANA